MINQESGVQELQKQFPLGSANDSTPYIFPDRHLPPVLLNPELLTPSSNAPSGNC